MILSRLFVEGFRAIGPGPLEIPLAPLTVFVGKNGCGKTSLLEAIGLTAQSAVEQPDLHNLVLAGSRVAFEPAAADEGGSLFFGRNPGAKAQVGIEVQGITVSIGSQDEKNARALGFPHWPPARFEYRWGRTSARFPSWSHKFIADGILVFEAWSDCTPSADGRGASGTMWGRLHKGKPFQVSLGLDRVLGRDLLPHAGRRITSPDQPVNERQLGILQDLVQSILERLREKLARVQCLSAVRGVQLMHTDVGPEVEIVGRHGEQLVRLWSRMQAKSDPRLAIVRKWAEEFGLPNFSAGWTGDKTLAATYDDPTTTTRLDLQDAAGGSQHAAILAAQVLLTRKGSVIVIDEPEIGLHPAYERRLPELFLQAVRMGQQVIIATHSEVFIAALANAVRQKVHDLTPAHVGIWHLERNAKGTTAEQIKVSERGYLDRWVSSFAEVEKGLFEEWAKGLPEEKPARRSGHAPARKRGASKPRKAPARRKRS